MSAAIEASFAALHLRRGRQPPVLVSSNLDKGDAANERLLQAYRGRVSYI